MPRVLNCQRVVVRVTRYPTAAHVGYVVRYRPVHPPQRAKILGWDLRSKWVGVGAMGFANVGGKKKNRRRQLERSPRHQPTKTKDQSYPPSSYYSTDLQDEKRVLLPNIRVKPRRSKTMICLFDPDVGFLK